MTKIIYGNTRCNEKSRLKTRNIKKIHLIIHKRDKELYLLNILWIFPLRLTKKQFYQIRLKDSEKNGGCINVKIRTEISGSHWALSIHQKFRFESYKFHVPNGTVHSGYTDPSCHFLGFFKVCCIKRCCTFSKQCIQL